MTSRVVVVSTIVCAVVASAARADDLSGADRILCSATTVTACTEDGVCELGTPDELNVPQFIEVDLAAKRLSTTKASGLNRQSQVESVKRVEGAIILQGVEKGRAYSFVIDERSGALSVAVAAPSRGVAAFGSCTPLTTSR